MKTGVIVLVMLMLSLVAVPLAPSGDSELSGMTDPSPARGGNGHGYRNGAGAGIPGSGMMPDKGHGPVPQAPRHGQESSPAAGIQREFQRDPIDWTATVRRLLLKGYRRLSGKKSSSTKRGS